MTKKNDDVIRENLKGIGTRIKEVRRTIRVTQKGMADKLGIFDSYLSDIETGKGNPGHAFFFKISSVFKVNLNYLLLGKGEMFSKPEQTPEEETYIEDIKSIEDIVWYMKKSPLFFHQVIAFASKFHYEHEELIKKNIEKNRPKKDEETTS
jgi:transcriptional regulator with XRE-family HTH domain